MENSEATTKALLYRALYHYIGLRGGVYWRKYKMEWRRKKNWPSRCFKCHDKVLPSMGKDFHHPKRLTFDHIIPKVIIYELNLYELLFDDDNFAIYCSDCNMAKGNGLPPEDEISPRLLQKFYTYLDKRKAGL